MKIAICNVQEFNPTIGGIERVSVSLAEGLIKEGVEVLFVACRKSPYSKPYTLPAKQLRLLCSKLLASVRKRQVCVLSPDVVLWIF